MLPSPNAAPRALIIGGSLSGLFTAITLRKIGWRVDIFERSAQALDSRGGGIVLQGDVLSAFHYAGVPHAQALGVQSRDRIFLDRDDHVVQRSFMPQTQTSWSLLYGTMKRHIPAEHVHAGEQLLRFTQEGERVTAHFASGRVETGDLLIGADGARSTVRQQLLPGLHPRYAGYVAWRGLVPEAALSPQASAMLEGTFAFQSGPDHLLLEYLVPGEDESTQTHQRRWNWVWYRKVENGMPLAELLTGRDGVRHAFSLPPGEMRDEAVALLQQMAREHLAPTFQELVAATEAPFLQSILDLQVPRMVFGRALLLGDAAFVPRPHTAGSTAKAAANALALARALEQADAADPVDLARRLNAWERTQLRDGLAMTKWGMSMGDQIMGLHRKPMLRAAE